MLCDRQEVRLTIEALPTADHRFSAGVSFRCNHFAILPTIAVFRSQCKIGLRFPRQKTIFFRKISEDYSPSVQRAMRTRSHDLA